MCYDSFMKKNIIIETFVLFASLVLLLMCIMFFYRSIYAYLMAKKYDNDSLNYFIAKQNLICGIISLIAFGCNLSALILFTIKEFQTFQPLIDKYNARKQERAAARAAKADADKQKRIEELQAELQELKKDDAPPSD